MSGTLALALLAGAAAAFNPCGFALLPAYLAVQVTGADRPLVRAARFTAGMAGGFVAVFGIAGLALAPLSAAGRWLPVVTVALGAALVAGGVALLLGRGPALWHVRGRAPGASWRAQLGYGVTFALASLSCTLAPFLAVTTVALRTGRVAGLVAAFLTYAAGMAAVVGVLAVLAATASAWVARVRRATPVVLRVSGVLLVLAGLYAAYYGVYELRVLHGGAGGAGLDPVVGAALRVQGWLVRRVQEVGAPGLVVLAVALGVIGLGAVGLSAVATRRRRTGAVRRGR